MVLEQRLELTEKPRTFVVVPPLDDVREQKLDTEHLGPMRMTSTVRYSLFALRGYLVLMIALVLYHALNLAGLF